jgi:hypothetical protein
MPEKRKIDMTNVKDVVKLLDKMPWLIFLGVVLLLNTLLNYTSGHVNVILPNALTQMFLFVMLGFSLYKNRQKEMNSSFNVFLMAGVFLLSTLLVWFNAGEGMLTASAWFLFLLQSFLLVITVSHWKDIKTLGTGVTWFYASLIFIMVFAVAGVWENYLHVGWSQSLLWNLSIAVTCFAYLTRKGSKNVYAVLALSGFLIAVIAAFGFAGQAMSLFPI